MHELGEVLGGLAEHVPALAFQGCHRGAEVLHLLPALLPVPCCAAFRVLTRALKACKRCLEVLVLLQPPCMLLSQLALELLQPSNVISARILVKPLYGLVGGLDFLEPRAVFPPRIVVLSLQSLIAGLELLEARAMLLVAPLQSFACGVQLLVAPVQSVAAGLQVVVALLQRVHKAFHCLSGCVQVLQALLRCERELPLGLPHHIFALAVQPLYLRAQLQHLSLSHLPFLCPPLCEAHAAGMQLLVMGLQLQLLALGLVFGLQTSPLQLLELGGKIVHGPLQLLHLVPLPPLEGHLKRQGSFMFVCLRGHGGHK
mmetsp:Transcript_9503/g.22415  ORF Transcript_9503/g.22415 Transcript_9503/m.22415 type:complete len:314 (-) Transcript_9503:24-965(-)